MPDLFSMYAYKGGVMSQETSLVRKSYFVDPEMVSKATKLLGTKSEAEAIRKIIAQFVKQERFWKMMHKTGGTLKKGSFIK